MGGINILVPVSHPHAFTLPNRECVLVAGREFYSGPPLHVGWWNASTECFHHYWRWWDGEKWSRHATAKTPPHIAAITALMAERDTHQKAIRWSLYWPPGAPPRDGPQLRIKRRRPQV